MKNHNKSYIILITAVASLGGLLFGYDTGVINGTQFFFSKYFALEPAMKGWVVGSALIGCFVGALSAGVISQQFGRKNSLILSAILFAVSAYGSGLPGFLPETVSMLVFFRIIGGLGIGIASMNAPMYIAEIAPAERRGNLVTYYQLAVVTGFFVVFLATYFIGQGNTEQQNIDQGWRSMFWTELIPASLFLILLFFVPKSPRWLAIKGRIEEGKQVLTKIHGPERAETEIVEIQESLKKEEAVKENVFSKSFLPIIIIGSVLSILQQFTGINAVLYYGADIFEKALGFGQDEVLAQQILLAGVNFLFTFVAMYTVDKLGRKPLIIIGSVGMILGFLLLGFTIKTGNVGVLSLIGVLTFIGSFALSMGPVVWVLLSEIFPNSIRSAAMSIAVAAQWGANYFVSQMFPVVVASPANEAGSYWNGSLPYFIFVAFILFIIVFTLKYLPETKGKSLEELEKIWKK